MHSDDRYAQDRARLLSPVAEGCGGAGIPVHSMLFRAWPGWAVHALQCQAANGSWDVTVTVVRGRLVQATWHGGTQRYTRDPTTGYDLASPGDLLFEVQITEDNSGLGGRGVRPRVGFDLFATADEAAKRVIEWVGRADRFRVVVPAVDPVARQRVQRRCFDCREAAAAVPTVEIATRSVESEADVDAVDQTALSGRRAPTRTTGPDGQRRTDPDLDPEPPHQPR